MPLSTVQSKEQYTAVINNAQTYPKMNIDTNQVLEYLHHQSTYRKKTIRQSSPVSLFDSWIREQ